MKRLIYVLVVLFIIAGLLILFRPALTNFAIKRHAMSIGDRFKTGLLTDGKMHIITVGTGSPSPDAGRVQSCTAVIVDKAFIMIDTGSSSAWRIDLIGLPVAALDAVFFTHHHSDHIADLPLMANISWRYGRKRKLHVYGPEGTESVVSGFNRAHRADLEFRYENMKAHFSSVDMALPVGYDFTNPGPEERKLVYTHKNGLKVYAFRVDHRPVNPAVGYRIEYKNRVIAISGDTRYCPNIARHAKGADILIHEAFNKELVDRMLALSDLSSDVPEIKATIALAKGVQDYHTSPLEAAELAEEAGVKKLVYTHIIPPLGAGIPRFLVSEPLFLEGTADVFKGEIVLAEDGMDFVLDLN